MDAFNPSTEALGYRQSSRFAGLYSEFFVRSSRNQSLSLGRSYLGLVLELPGGVYLLLTVRCLLHHVEQVRAGKL